MNLFTILCWKGSRKVSFGLYLFIVANAYLLKHLISSQEWFTSVCLCSALIGGGTIADRFMEVKKAEVVKPQ